MAPVSFVKKKICEEGENRHVEDYEEWGRFEELMQRMEEKPEI